MFKVTRLTMKNIALVVSEENYKHLNIIESFPFTESLILEYQENVAAIKFT